MSFPRYPKYKSTGIKWLGEVPEHWRVLPCRAIAQERTAKNDGAKCGDYLSLMANVGVIPYAEKGDVGNKKPEDLSKCKIVRRGDFVINSMNYGIGSYGLSDYDGVCSPVYIVLRAEDEAVEPRFAFRVFEDRAFQTFAQSFGNGILEHRCAINWDILKSIGVGVPPRHEQQAILTFLDSETAKIDELVAEQRRLIELLTEKRAAVISHALTNGLNPDAPKKPSHVTWLGDLPAHWGVTRVKHVMRSFEQGWSPQCEAEPAQDGQWGVLKVGCVNGGLFQPAENKALPADLEPVPALALSQGDLLISRANTRELVGSAAIVPADYPRLMICDKLYRLRTRGGMCDSQYLSFFLASAPARGRIEFDATGASASMVNIGQGTILEMSLPLPPFDEQLAIVRFTEQILTELHRLAAEANRGVDLLEERRAALVSAAVTGQIDVRGLASLELT